MLHRKSTVQLLFRVFFFCFHVRFLLEDTSGLRAANTAATEADVKYEFGSASR